MNSQRDHDKNGEPTVIWSEPVKLWNGQWVRYGASIGAKNGPALLLDGEAQPSSTRQTYGDIAKAAGEGPCLRCVGKAVVGPEEVTPGMAALQARIDALMEAHLDALAKELKRQIPEARPSAASTAATGETPSIHDRLVRAIEQAGHPDWSLKKMIDTLRRIAVDARQLERELAASTSVDHAAVDAMNIMLTKENFDHETAIGALQRELAEAHRLLARAILPDDDGKLRASAVSAIGTLTDEQIVGAAANAADASDATRVSEMRPEGWRSTTIFEGDAGLIRFGRLVEKAIRAQRAETFTLWQEIDSVPARKMVLLWHRAWRHVWAGQVIDNATGECVLDSPTPEHKVIPHFASHWLPLPAPRAEEGTK